jgi:hypothetical protein
VRWWKSEGKGKALGWEKHQEREKLSAGQRRLEETHGGA